MKEELAMTFSIKITRLRAQSSVAATSPSEEKSSASQYRDSGTHRILPWTLP